MASLRICCGETTGIPYHFAFGLRDYRGLTPIPSTAMMIEAFL
jgi:hypothetical protein